MELLNLTWLIPVFPLLAFGAVALFAHPSRKLSHALVIGGIGISFLLAQLVFWRVVLEPEVVTEHPFNLAVNWLPTGTRWFQMGAWVDPLTAVMLLMVPLVCLMIFIYSVGYMNFGTPQEDPRYSRFFAYISLFATGMLGMVVANNLLMLFVFWEVMGLCSYLLIGFWFEKTYADPKRITPKQAGLKAFITTRVGDMFLLLGILALYSVTGSLAYADVFNHETLEALAHAELHVLGLALPALPTIAILIFGGAVGKSAQFPLHVWLPDAMEGPTPVSALIHAATMVSAGVYLVARCFPLFSFVAHGPQMTVVWAIGAFTAIFSAVIGIAQNDIKRVLAFSTISQLGYMIAALGIGAYVAGAFHLITHAFFKALLFLGSGSVIHGMEHGHHHAHEHYEQAPHAVGGQVTTNPHEVFDPNDMRNMGGLRKRMPRTFWTFLIGGLALSGFPLITAGFWSKDEILAQAYKHNPIVFWTLAVAAFLTAFYTMRQISMTFFGPPRTKAAAHAPESVPSMTVPLIILAVFAVGLGWLGIPDNFLGVDWGPINWFHHFVGATNEAGHAAEGAEHAVAAFHFEPLLVSIIFALSGLGLGWLVYGWRPRQRAEQMDPLEAGMRKVALGWFYHAIAAKFYFDELYGATFIRGSILLSQFFAWFDRTVVDGVVNLAGRAGAALSDALSLYVDILIIDGAVNGVGRGGALLSQALNLIIDIPIVDGAVNGVGRLTEWLGEKARRLQTGLAQNYLLQALLSVLALLILFLAVATMIL